jgi:hypothetical protein
LLTLLICATPSHAIDNTSFVLETASVLVFYNKKCERLPAKVNRAAAIVLGEVGSRESSFKAQMAAEYKEHEDHEGFCAGVKENFETFKTVIFHEANKYLPGFESR